MSSAISFINIRNSKDPNTTFIRPILEYGCEVWDNCGAINSDRLEQVQTEAARIVTGLTSYASLDSIYCETGWEKLTDHN
jgi:hypothetical protein